MIIPWIKNYFSVLKTYFPDIKTDNLSTNFIPRWKASLLKEDGNLSVNGLSEDIYFSKGCIDEFHDGRLLELERNDRTTDISHFQVSLLKYCVILSIIFMLYVKIAVSFLMKLLHG